jgi:hypothetical protein
VEREPLATHQDVTTIMVLLADIHRDVERIRRASEDEDGEEEEDGGPADG